MIVLLILNKKTIAEVEHEGVKFAISNIAYLFSTANEADKLLMPVMIGSVILECVAILINTIFPKYIIDGLTTNQSLQRCSHSYF